MKLKPIYLVTKKKEAREIAIKWQKYISEASFSYGEIAEFQGYFEALAKKFDLVEEFKENAII